MIQSTEVQLFYISFFPILTMLSSTHLLKHSITALSNQRLEHQAISANLTFTLALAPRITSMAMRSPPFSELYSSDTTTTSTKYTTVYRYEEPSDYYVTFDDAGMRHHVGCTLPDLAQDVPSAATISLRSHDLRAVMSKKGQQVSCLSEVTNAVVSSIFSLIFPKTQADPTEAEQQPLLPAAPKEVQTVMKPSQVLGTCETRSRSCRKQKHMVEKVKAKRKVRPWLESIPDNTLPASSSSSPSCSSSSSQAPFQIPTVTVNDEIPQSPTDWRRCTRTFQPPPASSAHLAPPTQAAADEIRARDEAISAAKLAIEQAPDPEEDDSSDDSSDDDNDEFERRMNQFEGWNGYS